MTGTFTDHTRLSDEQIETLIRWYAAIHMGAGTRFFATASALRQLRAEIVRLRADLAEARAALAELVECAELRGDADLPHPADDPRLWTARMQDAWNAARAMVACSEFDASLAASRQVERNATGAPAIHRAQEAQGV